MPFSTLTRSFIGSPGAESAASLNTRVGMRDQQTLGRVVLARRLVELHRSDAHDSKALVAAQLVRDIGNDDRNAGRAAHRLDGVDHVDADLVVLVGAAVLADGRDELGEADVARPRSSSLRGRLPARPAGGGPDSRMHVRNMRKPLASCGNAVAPQAVAAAGALAASLGGAAAMRRDMTSSVSARTAVPTWPGYLAR